MSENKENTPKSWSGGDKPFNFFLYGKLMMWFFLITDALTFSGFLAYGWSRFKYPEIWPNPEDVFSHFPFLEGDHPLLFVALNDVYTNYEFCNNGISCKLWT